MFLLFQVGTPSAASAAEETRYENKTNDMIWLELQAWFAGEYRLLCFGRRDPSVELGRKDRGSLELMDSIYIFFLKWPPGLDRSESLTARWHSRHRKGLLSILLLSSTLYLRTAVSGERKGERKENLDRRNRALGALCDTNYLDFFHQGW